MSAKIKAVSRRGFLQSGAVTAAGLAAACAPSAQAPASGPASSTGNRAEWEQKWDELVAAAKKEGKVVVQVPVGAGYRQALEVFAKAFPGVEPEEQAFPDGATYVPKIQGERRAGIYSFDVAAVPAIPPLQILKHEGAYESLRPVIFRADVMDDKVWHGGFEGHWADIPKQIAFRFQTQVQKSFFINTDLVKPEEITKLDDYLNPKWKGKIIMSDVRQGYVYSPSSVLRKLKGDDWLKRLLIDQQPEQVRDRRQAVEGIVRGRHPLAFGIHPFILQDFRNEGLAKNIRHAELSDYPGTAGGDIVLLFNKAPHPNAATLFINWLLTKEGGQAWSTNTKANSGRIDVPIVDENSAPKSGVKYPDPTQEEALPFVGETQEWLIKLAGA